MSKCEDCGGETHGCLWLLGVCAICFCFLVWTVRAYPG